MADIADLANDRAQWLLDQALAAHSAKAVGESRAECTDCNDPIPEARRLAVMGCLRCAECQGHLEKLGARRAG